MANFGCTILLILAITVTSCLCQTFQYSRGWTNGKRSESTSEQGPMETRHQPRNTGYETSDRGSRFEDKSRLGSRDYHLLCLTPCASLNSNEPAYGSPHYFADRLVKKK